VTSVSVLPTPPHLSDLRIATVDEDQVEDYQKAISLGFHSEFRPEDFAVERELMEVDRCIGFRAGDRWVATALTLPRRMSVPGGSVGIAAVTAVTVAPAYRRRGLLTEMMRLQLAEAANRGTEPIALLFASESLIYGRFGYGSLTQQLQVSGPTRELAFLPEVDLGRGSVDEVTVDQFLAAVKPLRESIFADRPGHLVRDDAWWRSVLYDPEHWRRGAGARRYVLHFAEDGAPDGFAMFRIKRDSAIQHGQEVSVTEIDAANPPAYAALWRFLLDLDLIRGFSRHNAPTDEPLRQLVANPRMIKTELTDGSYARIVDVPGALGARRYNADLDLVIEIVDRFMPDLGGRFRLQGGADGATVTRTDETADVTLTARQLGAIYLGGTTARDLGRAGLIDEHTPGSVGRLTVGFAGDRAPFCPDFF
jgi:predicted acetyltransferase